MAHHGYDFCKNKTNRSEFQSESPHPKQTPEPYIKVDKQMNRHLKIMCFMCVLFLCLKQFFSI